MRGKTFLHPHIWGYIKSQVYVSNSIHLLEYKNIYFKIAEFCLDKLKIVMEAIKKRAEAVIYRTICYKHSVKMS